VKLLLELRNSFNTVISNHFLPSVEQRPGKVFILRLDVSAAPKIAIRQPVTVWDEITQRAMLGGWGSGRGRNRRRPLPAAGARCSIPALEKQDQTFLER